MENPEGNCCKCKSFVEEKKYKSAARKQYESEASKSIPDFKVISANLQKVN